MERHSGQRSALPPSIFLDKRRYGLSLGRLAIHVEDKKDFRGNRQKRRIQKPFFWRTNFSRLARLREIRQLLADFSSLRLCLSLPLCMAVSRLVALAPA